VKDDPGCSGDWISGKKQPAVRAPSQGQDTQVQATPTQAQVQAEASGRGRDGGGGDSGGLKERWECDEPFRLGRRFVSMYFEAGTWFVSRSKD
jgi:hypothetical protein